MPVTFLLLGTLLSLSQTASPPTTVSATDFHLWFDAARIGELTIPTRIERKASRLRYVFVGGFGGERPGNYFTENARELRRHSVPKRMIHYIFPSSDKSVDENVAEVRKYLFEIDRDGPERLVLIAHSRGACDVLAFALQEPDFIEQHVAAIFLIQGPFGGTALADYIHGTGPVLDRRLKPRHRIITYLLGRLERFRLRQGRHGGLADLVRDESRQFWSRMLQQHSAAVPIVSPRTFFIQSKAAPWQLAWLRRALGWFLTTYDGSNDGAVAVTDQCLPGIGTSLGVYHCGHGELTRRTRVGRSARRLPRALIQSIIMAVGQEEEQPTQIAEAVSADSVPTKQRFIRARLEPCRR